MVLKKALVCLAGMALGVGGCASSGGPQAAQPVAAGVAPVKSLTVRLDQKDGIGDSRLLNPNSPYLLAKDGELLLLEDSADYDFDVTFILDISEARMQQYLGRPGLTGVELTSQFIDRLKSDGNLAPHDVECLEPPRCEVTYQTRGTNQGVRIPYALLDLGGAKIAAFYVFTVDRRGEGDDDDLYRDAPQPRGFVGLETKFVPELEIPLDNTGIADWGFLNPRSPNYLSGASTAMQAVSRGADLSPSFASLSSAISGLAPVALAEEDPASETTKEAADKTKKWAEAVARELEAIQRTRLSGTSEAVTRVNRTLQGRASLATRKVLDINVRPECSAPPAETEKLTAPLSRSLVEAARLVCESTAWAIDQVATVGLPEAMGAIDLADATLNAVGAARSIVTTALLNNFIDPAYGGQVEPRLVEIGKIWKDAPQPIAAIFRDSAITREAKQGLGRLAARQPREELVSVVSSANEVVKQVEAEINRFAERQRIVRFSNRTLDRTFIVSFTVLKDKLVEGIVPAQQKSGESKDEETRKLETIESYYADGLDLTATDGNVTVSFRVDPGSHFDADAWLLSKAPKDIVPFEADFFDQTDEPAQSRGYIGRKKINPQDRKAQPDNSFVSNLVIGLTGKYEPCFGDPDTCPGPVTAALPYTGERKEHYEGRGQLDLFQSLGNWANGKVSLIYKSTDFGKAETTTTVSQYQANIFGTNNTTLSLGKFTFAAPANQIAASVTGDGVRFTFHSLWLSYLIKRESDSEVSDDHDKDHDLWMVQWNQPIRRSRFFRKVDLLYLRGDDQCKPIDGGTDGGRCVDPAFRQEYLTYGGELFFTAPFGRTSADPRERNLPLTGSIAAFRSERDSRGIDYTLPTSFRRRDGKGTVALLTVGRPFGFVPESEGSRKVKPLHVLTSVLGYGTGDDPETSRDEGFLGETPGFAPDQVFLKTIANKLDHVVPLASVGKGLSNKWYYGLQYTDNGKSLLGWISAFVQANPDDIVSETTTISVHGYRMHEPVFDDRDLGHEFDLEFRMEQPKNVKWRVTGGYFIPGDALRDIVKKEVLSVTAGVVIEPAKLAF